MIAISIMPKIKKDFRWKNKFVSEKVYKQRISQTKNGQNISDNRAANDNIRY